MVVVPESEEDTDVVVEAPTERTLVLWPQRCRSTRMVRLWWLSLVLDGILVKVLLVVVQMMVPTMVVPHIYT